MRITPMISALSAILLVTSACGPDGSAEPAAASVGVQVDPPTALVEPSGTVAFRATITGTAATGVQWTVDCGSITQAGVYSAPQSNGTCRVTATSVGAAVSGSALVSVGAGSTSPSTSGWATSCAAEPEPTTNVIYACDCQPGADANCVAGNDVNAGTSKSAPIRSWAKVAEKFRALAAGGTVALCKGGQWNGDENNGGLQAWHNNNCTTGSPCVLRDYVPASGGAARPKIAVSNAGTNGMTFWGDASVHNAAMRVLNLRFFRPDAGATVTAQGSSGIRAADNAANVEVCNCEIDGFGLGFYAGDVGASCRTANWKIRGNRIINNCTDAMLVGFKDTDIDGNLFDNNGHGRCGSYDLSSPSGGTTHTLYLDGRQCPEENVRVINNEVRRNAVYQGYPQGSPWGIAGGGRNVTFENNLIDMTPVHPTMSGGAIFGGNDNPSYISLDGITIRRNRILAGRGRQIGMSSVMHGLIEDNTIIISEPGNDSGDIIAYPHEQGTVAQTSVVVRNNTIYVTKAAPSGLVGIRVATASATTGNIVTGNSVTFAGGGGTCFRADSASKVAYMDNNQCSGASSYATNNSSWYSLAGWRSATGFDATSITPPLTGLFVNAPTDLTPILGSPLVGAASTASTCTVLGVANQHCSSPIAIGNPTWSPLDGGTARSATPSIGAFDR
jgi:hypothetical protein